MIIGDGDHKLIFAAGVVRKNRAVQVIVIGAGVSGLTSALALQADGHRVTVVTADPSEDSTSFLAAAVWFPTHAGPPDLVQEWSRTTFDVLVQQARDGIPGVVMRETMALYRQPPGRPDWTGAVGRVRDAEPNELPVGYPYGLRFVVPLVEMPLYLPWLREQFMAQGGQLDLRRVQTPAELASESVGAVINCSGLAARELVGDESVYPVRGQIVRVSNPGLTMSVRDEDHPDGRAYVHPRTDDVILGGTLDEHVWDTTVDSREAEAIVRRCTDLVPELATAKIIEHVVGLRPGRPTTRVEESAPLPGGTRLIHNYGHGGSGITLSWGCAADVARLVGT